MKKWNLIIDVERCENCNNCVLAAKDEYVGNEYPGYSAAADHTGAELISITRKNRGTGALMDTAYLVKMCNHCDDAPCIKNASDVIHKRDDGIVIIDPDKAKGRKDIVKSCPYGAIVWNETLKVPQTWIFDAHLLDQGWDKPRCQQTCPTGVFDAVKITDAEMAKRAEEMKLETLGPYFGEKARVFYKNLHRVTKNFIAGSVVTENEGVEECVAGAKVSLLLNGSVVANTLTSDFGEFKFDHIDSRTKGYQVVIEKDGLAEICRTVDSVNESICLTEISMAAQLQPSVKEESSCI
ncbi:carboxypeptidase regulatory-like domain-containing protein [Maricurvus nonylphenolicus]|uniref:4Fe-4S dicluster domain-containing protein n=1 Tax=Maricurvus nonylphenolicus TaxID=1008307 RepID=UPI0036F33C2D